MPAQRQDPDQDRDPLPSAAPWTSGPWTARDIERWLLQPMRQLRQGVALLAAPGNALVPADPDRPSASFDVLAFARSVLGKDSPELRAVVTWARIRAQGGDSEASIAEWCREAGEGWSERTFHRRRKRACERLARAKNQAEHETARRVAAAS